MALRQTVQFLVYPKYFNVVSFYSKGNYSLTFKLIQIDQDGKQVTAYPTLYCGRDCSQVQARKPSIKIHNKQGSYTTEQFYVTYNQENFVLNSLCTFRLQYEHGKEYKTYLQITMNLTKYINTGSNTNRYDPQNSGRSLSVSKAQKTSLQVKTTRKVYSVDKRTIFFNRKQSDKTQQLNNFKRIVFSECQYFSYMDLYLGSVSLGSSFRAQKFQMCQFISMPAEEKVNYVLKLQTNNAFNLPDKQNKGKQIYQNFANSVFGNKSDSYLASADFSKSLLCKYYGLMIVKPVKEYERLISVYNGLNTKMIVLNNTSQLHQKIKMPLIDCLSLSNQINKDYTTIVNYYGYNRNKYIIYDQILQESKAIYRNVLYLWQQFIQLLLKTNLSVFRLLVVHQLSTKDSFVKKSAIIKNCQIQLDSRSNEKNSFISKRKQILQSQLIYQDQDIYHPLLMIEGTDPNADEDHKFKIGLQITSLTIFVHGYQGSDYDMEKAKNYLNLYNRETYSLLIKSISQEQEADIEEMGKTVSEQIIAHLSNTPYQYKKINFIGYSLGGVIARETLKHLQKYKKLMNIFVSFASPHLGIKNSENSLVNTGVWYLVNVSKVKAMKTLYGHTPTQNTRSTLSKLSQCQGLSWFDRVVLVSSKQDNFVPYYSSRLQQVTDDEMSNMCRSLKLKIKKLERVQVWFDVEHNISTIDKVLGRRAHIQFLENSGFLDSFFKIYGSQF